MHSPSIRLPRRARRGLTLVELLIVLTIITAVAGIVIPIIPDSRQRSHGATGAGNIRELAKAVEIHNTSTGSYGNGWDSLIDTSGAVVAATDLTLLDVGSPALGSTAEAVNNALALAGITTAYQHDDFDGAGINQTFEGLTIPLADELGARGNVAVLTADGEERLGLAPSGLAGNPVAYIAFGLGQESTMVGRSILDAPVQYPQGATNPDELYSRFILIFAIPETGGSLQLASISGVEGQAGGDRLRRLGDYQRDYFNTFN